MGINKYVIDIDGTICSKLAGEEYSKCVPYKNRIDIINDLYEQGHKIIYYTARGMSRDNNQLFVIAQYYSLTEKQLNDWGAKYNLLILGKPSGDYYIDDKGVNANEFFKDDK